MEFAETWNSVGLDTWEVLIGAGVAAFFQWLKTRGVAVGGPKPLKWAKVSLILLGIAVADSQIRDVPWFPLWFSAMAANGMLYAGLRTVVSGKEPEGEPVPDPLDQPGTSDDVYPDEG